MVRGNRSEDKMKFKYHTDWFLDENKKRIPVRRPRIEIILRKNSEVKSSSNPEFRTHGLVDSGADICLVPRQIADVLQIDLNSAQKKESTGADGKFDTYQTQVYLELVYRNIPVGIEMVDVSIPEKDPDGIDLDQNILLGRRDLFKKYEITFNEVDKTILFKKIQPNSR
jgi:predicted aspartyl protease